MADSAYGLWPLVIVNTLLFVTFRLSFFHPRTNRDWRAIGAYTAFLVALFAEMYVIPLAVYLLGSWLGSRYPLLPGTHAGGHLWNDLIGWIGDPCLSPFHPASYAAIGIGALAALVGMFVVIGAGAGDNRLRLAGYRTSVVLTARLAVVGVSATVLALAATVLMRARPTGTTAA